MRSFRHLLLTSMLCLLAWAPHLHAATATATRPAVSKFVRFKAQFFTVSPGNGDDLVVDTRGDTGGIYLPVLITPGAATTTLNSISDGTMRGQVLELFVTGTNALVVPTSLTNVDFGTAGNQTVYEGASCRLVWDGTDWRLGSVSGLTASVSELNALDGITSTVSELNLNDNQWADAVFTVGADAGTTITVNIQFNDAAGTAMATPVAVMCYTSSDAAGLDLAATADNIAAGTDGSVAETVDNSVIFAVSEADGDLDIVVTEASTDDVYLVCVRPNGQLDISAILDFS